MSRIWVHPATESDCFSVPLVLFQRPIGSPICCIRSDSHQIEKAVFRCPTDKLTIDGEGGARYGNDDAE